MTLRQRRGAERRGPVGGPCRPGRRVVRLGRGRSAVQNCGGSISVDGRTAPASGQSAAERSQQQRKYSKLHFPQAFNHPVPELMARLQRQCLNPDFAMLDRPRHIKSNFGDAIVTEEESWRHRRRRSRTHPAAVQPEKPAAGAPLLEPAGPHPCAASFRTGRRWCRTAASASRPAGWRRSRWDRW